MIRKPVPYYPSPEATRCLANLRLKEETRVATCKVPRTSLIDLAVRGFWKMYEEDADRALRMARDAR